VPQPRPTVRPHAGTFAPAGERVSG